MSTTCAFLKRYKIIDRIGEGSFSRVVKCLDTKTGAYVAAKTLKKRYDTWAEASDLAELVTMQRIPAHPNLLSMLGVHYDIFMGTVTFVFDLMDISLYDYMDSEKRCIQEIRAKHFLYQILSGLHHLYKFGVFHRDIKPENILMKIPADVRKDEDQYLYEIIKIGDLGSVKPVRSLPPYTEYISTRWYRSPECLLTKGYYESKMDIWAVGCVFYEMLTTKPLFAGGNEVDQLLKIHQTLGTPNNRTLMKFKRHKSCNWDKCPKIVGTGLTPLLSNISADGAHLMKMMITYDPEYRATIKQLLNHRYFNNMRKPIADLVRVEKTTDSFNKIQAKLKQVASSVNYRKMQQKRPICDIHSKNYGSNEFYSLTENNLSACNGIGNKSYESENFSNSISNVKLGTDRKYTKFTFNNNSYSNNNYGNNYSHRIKTEDYNKTQDMIIRKDFKSKTQELTKPCYEKQSILTSVTDANTYKQRTRKFHDTHRTKIKKNIETTKHNFENYNEIMKRIESRRNIDSNKSIHNYQDERKYYTKPKYEEINNKIFEPKKHIMFSHPPKEYKQTFDCGCQRKCTGDQMEIDKPYLIRKPYNNSRDTLTNNQSKHCIISRGKKRLEPIDEVIQPKRQKLFQVEASIRNLSKYMDSSNVRKIL